MHLETVQEIVLETLKTAVVQETAQEIVIVLEIVQKTLTAKLLQEVDSLKKNISNFANIFLIVISTAPLVINYILM